MQIFLNWKVNLWVDFNKICGFFIKKLRAEAGRWVDLDKGKEFYFIFCKMTTTPKFADVAQPMLEKFAGFRCLNIYKKINIIYVII